MVIRFARGISLFWSSGWETFTMRVLSNGLLMTGKSQYTRCTGVSMRIQRADIYTMDRKGKDNYRVNAAIKKGIYVIIDWHDHYAHKNQKEL
jgi:endoglucanase